MKHRRLAAAAVSLVLAVGALGGCEKENAGSDLLPEAEKGKYVEEEQALPEEWEDWTVKQLFARDEKLHFLLAKEEGGSLRLQEWEQQEDSYINVTEGWLNMAELPAQVWMELKVMYDGNGTGYLFAEYVEEESYRSHLWRSDGEGILDITPEKWTVPDEEYGIYEFVYGIAALDNGTVAANCSRSVDLFYGEDGSLLESEASEGYYAGTVLSDGKNLYLFSMDSGGAITRVEKRPGGKSSGSELIPFGQGSSASLCAGSDGTLISAGADGIFRCRAGEDDWEKLLAGTETDFSLSGCWCTGLAALTDGRIYAVFQYEDGTVKLKKYEFDPEAVTEVTETLKLYAVEESYLLQNAVALYHREHPEVAIEVEYAYTYNDKYSGAVINYDEVYQKLNTLLMTEEAPDILVLDHLKIDSFAEKGLLADINDVVGAMEERGELVSGVTGSFLREDGSRYVVPLQFAFTYITGRDIGEADMQSLESLAAFLKDKEESYLGAQTVEELVDKFYPFFCGDIVKDKELDKEALRGKLTALKAVADNCGIVTEHDGDNGRNGHCYNIWDLASGAKLGMDEGNGFNGCMFAVAITEYIGGEFTAFENSFTPMMQIGICTKSSYQDTARDFLGFVLSEAVQGTDYYAGFPVNTACLEELAAADRSGVQAETTIETADGGEEIFQISTYSRETAGKLLELCKGLDKPQKEDAKIREVLIESLGGYLSGIESMEEAITKIEAGLKMYLAE